MMRDTQFFADTLTGLYVDGAKIGVNLAKKNRRLNDPNTRKGANHQSKVVLRQGYHNPANVGKS